jgi:hypothetical protein
MWIKAVRHEIRSLKNIWMQFCRRFDPGGSLDRRVNCRCMPQPRWVGARRNTKGGKPRLRVVLRQSGCACSRGLQAFARERERERACSSAHPPARPPSRMRALDLPFIDVRRGSRCTMGVYQYANESGREEPKPYVHANVAVGEVLEPCACDVVAVGGALEPCRSTAVGAAGTLLTSPCFLRGLRTAVVMGVRGVPSLLVYRGEPDGTPVLFP